MAAPPPIRPPLARRISQFRCRVLPIVVFLGSGAMATRLWERHYLTPSVAGEVFAAQADAISRADGILEPQSVGPLDLLDRVRAGQVIARLDARPALAALATLRAELARLRSESEATAEEVRQEHEDRLHDRRSETTRLLVRVETLRLDALDRRAQLAESRVERQRYDEQFRMLSKLHVRNNASDFQVIEAQLLRDAVEQRIRGGEEALKEVESQSAACRGRVEEDEAIRSAESSAYDPEKLLAPARAAIAVQEARIRELDLRVEALEVRAPIGGQVVAIARWPGQAVRAGDAIVTIASDTSRYIVGYLRQEQRIRPWAGMVVDIRSRTPPVKTFRSRVEDVGPQVLAVPAHQLRDPKALEWGLPVRVALPAGSDFRPGELVNLTFRPGAPPGS